jgi:hypothetical protein
MRGSVRSLIWRLEGQDGGKRGRPAMIVFGGQDSGLACDNFLLSLGCGVAPGLVAVVIGPRLG